LNKDYSSKVATESELGASCCESLSGRACPRPS